MLWGDKATYRCEINNNDVDDDNDDDDDDTQTGRLFSYAPSENVEFTETG